MSGCQLVETKIEVRQLSILGAKIQLILLAVAAIANGIESVRGVLIGFSGGAESGGMSAK